MTRLPCIDKHELQFSDRVSPLGHILTVNLRDIIRATKDLNRKATVPSDVLIHVLKGFAQIVLFILVRLHSLVCPHSCYIHYSI